MVIAAFDFLAFGPKEEIKRRHGESGKLLELNDGVNSSKSNFHFFFTAKRKNLPISDLIIQFLRITKYPYISEKFWNLTIGYWSDIFFIAKKGKSILRTEGASLA